ncbi:MAG: hypothetical protein R2709_09320 [Marmoricola sp.]
MKVLIVDTSSDGTQSLWMAKEQADQDADLADDKQRTQALLDAFSKRVRLRHGRSKPAKPTINRKIRRAVVLDSKPNTAIMPSATSSATPRACQCQRAFANIIVLLESTITRQRVLPLIWPAHVQ